MSNFLDPKRPTTRALLVGVQTPDMKPGEGAELLTELNELVENLGLEISHSTLITLRDRHQPKFLIGTGKAAELIAKAKEDGADVIVIDEELSPAQQRNWEEESGLAVIDRQEVILEIFADRAQTREAVLQVALARMEYSLPRLTRAWSHLSRQRGKGKMGGEGETQLEQDRRLVRNRITKLKSELAQVLWAVQMSTVEFHPWNSRKAHLEEPDEWRIDLDPMPDCPLDRVRRVAHVVHEVLDELGAVGWPKTSGGRGIHVYVRIPPPHGFADVRRAALPFAREAERRARGLQAAPVTP